ncbi:uncharacterized protein LOC132066033 [Lycium ferocissimum]|uniref:uncharacterized protein LOC132066033 n=1 Tax=Lycium ferocissimum TaxID=112874 RepID=UPI0028163A1C|nr:uncharacterized protein LOC132066033 [Lycium ferocissimum]
MRGKQSIQVAFHKLDDKGNHDYLVRLNASIDVVRILLNQGLALRGHDESESSLNKGNFLEVLSWYADRYDEIKPYVLGNAPKNNKMTSHDIQKDIVTHVDESRDVSRKEQMAICLRYVDKKGFVMEAFIGLVNVKDTSALSLKKAIVDVLVHHSLTLSYVGELVLLVSNILTVLGSSFKCVDAFRESQKEKLRDVLDMGELETGRGLNQELGLIKAGASASGFLRSCQTFETVFLLHLITDILGITYDLNVSLQKKEQDIANAMILVKVAKRRLQALRDNEWDPLLKKNIGWDSLKEKVETFCIKHKIPLPNYDDPYANSGRSRRKVVDHSTLHYYRVNMFYKIIDWYLQELNDRSNEVTSDLLNGVACLNPINSFSSFDIKKIMRMAELYPDDFDGFSIRALENQLANYIIDVRDIDKRFSNLGGHGELSRKLVRTKKHLTYSLVFLLVNFALLLPVATATVERAFSAMKFIKNDLRNRMEDEFLDGCMVPFVEKKVFKDVSNECIRKTFQEMKPRQVQL